MSYHVPAVGESVVFVDATRNTQRLAVVKVVDRNAGIIELDLGSREIKPIRYVDPAGATRFEIVSWHFPGDDTSRIVRSEVFGLGQPPRARRLVHRGDEESGG